MNIGDRFLVVTQFEARQDSQLLARFLPGLAYTLTPRNQPFVEAALSRGDAQLVTKAPSVLEAKAGGAQGRGSISIGKKG